MFFQSLTHFIKLHFYTYFIKNSRLQAFFYSSPVIVEFYFLKIVNFESTYRVQCCFLMGIFFFWGWAKMCYIIFTLLEFSNKSV